MSGEGERKRVSRQVGVSPPTLLKTSSSPTLTFRIWDRKNQCIHNVCLHLLGREGRGAGGWG